MDQLPESVCACLIGGHQKTLSSKTRTRFWKVQSGTLTPCLAAPCLRQSNTPSHVVCCHGSKDPSHSVCKNIALDSQPLPLAQLPLLFQKHLPLQKSLKSFFSLLFFFFNKSNVFCDGGLGRVMVESTVALLGLLGFFFFFYSERQSFRHGISKLL